MPSRHLLPVAMATCVDSPNVTLMVAGGLPENVPQGMVFWLMKRSMSCFLSVSAAMVRQALLCLTPQGAEVSHMPYAGCLGF